MGGDHKCPVCQATFTRPQHVARHMRSHTGDRPYKCQFCGDQFARSDLLSRHVNKCHANEKPLANTSTRRKGSASTSRATTSKQACDQCVQSSLPCDGSNPCAKCVQRKYRCTYVKFHRQTAPVGPGHQPPRTTTSVPPQPSVQVPSLLGSSSAGSRYPIYSEDFVMPGSSAASGSYPGQAQVSAALHDALYPSQNAGFSYANSLYPNSSADPADYPGKYSRSHDDLYRTSPTSSLAPSSASGSAPSSWVSGSATAGGWPAGHSSSQDAYHHPSQLERPVYSQPQHTLAPHQQHGDLSHTHTVLHPLGVRAGQAAASGGQPTGEGAHFREIFAEDFAPGPRRGSLSLSDGYGHSEGTDGSGSESGGYYAASSNVRGKKARYLDETVAGIDQPSPFSFDPHVQHARGGTSGSASSSSHHYSDSGSDPRPGSTHSNISTSSFSPHPPGTASSTTSSTSGAPPGSATSGTFFNAFDSLSIDDPAVLAQLAANGGSAAGVAPDGSPFFAHMNLDHLGAPAGHPFPGGGDSHADPDATPMPIKEEPSGGVRLFEGGRIQRPLSSLAALQPSSTNGLNWNSYLGLGTPSAHGSNNNSSLSFLGGWTPGGGNSTLAGLDMAGVPSFGTGLTPAKDMDSKEMKEFWKQYLKTPLTTGGDPMDVAASGADASTGAGPATPFRRPRVTSMPSSNKTPLAGDRDRLNAANQYYQQSQRAGGLGPTSSMRTTLHPSAGGSSSKKEDLGSYEAAVLARKTPINLNMGRLSSRRRGGSLNPPLQPGSTTSGLSKASSSGDNLTMMQVYGGQMAQSQGRHHHHQRQHHPHQQHHQQQRQVVANGSDGDTSASASPASRASSLAAEAYPSPRGYAHDVDMDAGSRPGSSAGLGLAMGGGAAGQALQRPTAKRLASTVLESGTSKAMKFDDSPQSPSFHGQATNAPGNATGISLPQLHPASTQAPVQALGSVNSLPPISTNFEGYGQKPVSMMAPPPPSSAPPMSGSVLNMNLQRGSLAERRRMSAAAGGEMRN